MKKQMHNQNGTLDRFLATFNQFIGSGVLIAVVILSGATVVSAAQKSQIKKIPCVTVVSKNGDQHPGRVFDVSDTSLTLWCSEELYSDQNRSQHSRNVHYSEISHIIIEEKGNTVSGVVIGTLLGATLGLFSSQLVPVTWTNVNWSPFEMAETMLETPMVLICAVLGGVAGALNGIDTKVQINGDIESFHNIVPILQEIKVKEGESP